MFCVDARLVLGAFRASPLLIRCMEALLPLRARLPMLPVIDGAITRTTLFLHADTINSRPDFTPYLPALEHPLQHYLMVLNY